MMESGPSGLASTSVSSVLSTLNAIPACTPTLCVAVRAGKHPYFVVKVLYSVLSLILHMFPDNSSKTNFCEMYYSKRDTSQYFFCC